MSYSQMAQLELLNALNNINSEDELNEFKDLVASYFAQKTRCAKNGNLHTSLIFSYLRLRKPFNTHPR